MAIRAGISEAFDSPAERLAAAFKSLGVTIPQTAEAYEQIVRSQDLTTEAGRNLAVSLLQAKAIWDEVQRQRAPIMAILQQVAARHPASVRVWDPLSRFCDDTACYASQPGMVRYKDQNHITASMARTTRYWLPSW